MVSCEAVPHRVWCSMAQPQRCMVIACTRTWLRVCKVMAWPWAATSARRAGRSRHQVLRTLLGAAVLQRVRLEAAAQLDLEEHACAICCRPAVRAVQPHVVWQCTAEAAVSAAAGPSRRRGLRACQEFRPYPVDLSVQMSHARPMAGQMAISESLLRLGLN